MNWTLVFNVYNCIAFECKLESMELRYKNYVVSREMCTTWVGFKHCASRRVERSLSLSSSSSDSHAAAPHRRSRTRALPSRV